MIRDGENAMLPAAERQRLSRQALLMLVALLLAIVGAGVAQAQGDRASAKPCRPVGTRDNHEKCHLTKFMADLANVEYQHSFETRPGPGALARARQAQEEGCRQIAAISGTDASKCHDKAQDRAIAATRTGVNVAELSCPSCGLAQDPGKTTCHELREKAVGALGGNSVRWRRTRTDSTKISEMPSCPRPIQRRS